MSMRRVNNRENFRKLTSILISIAFMLVFYQLTASASEEAKALPNIKVVIIAKPEIPEFVEAELKSILTGTLEDVLFDDEDSTLVKEENAGEIAEAIRTGINILIEPRGFTVAELKLDFSKKPVSAIFTVHPVNWKEDDPHAVKDVEIELEPDGLQEFWLQRFRLQLEEKNLELKARFAPILVGLPVKPLDEDWLLSLVMPVIRESDALTELFQDFEIDYDINLDLTAVVKITLKPKGALVELVRPRMYSRTIPNIVLDRFRERLISYADILEKMPKSQIALAENEIETLITQMLKGDNLAKELNAHIVIEIEVLENSPVALVTASVESETYDISLETFIDFGNESRDSTEVQARIGFIFVRGAEVFVNFNFFTNDNTLETDYCVGLMPGRSTFIAGGYDTKRSRSKFFIEQKISEGLKLRGEIFEEDNDFNEFGITYQFQQYLSMGIFTNGTNEFWLRGIIEL